MTAIEWRDLIRYAKNNNEYHKLTLCVEEHLRLNTNYNNISHFYNSYTQKTIKQWYQTCYAPLLRDRIKRQERANFINYG